MKFSFIFGNKKLHAFVVICVLTICNLYFVQDYIKNGRKKKEDISALVFWDQKFHKKEVLFYSMA